VSPPKLFDFSRRAAPLGGRTALVTGGSRGIGRAIVERLAADGAAVVFSYASDGGAAAEVEAAAAKLPGSARAEQAELGTPGAARALFDAADSSLGGLDVLVANAGVGGRGELAELEDELFDRVLEVNLRSTFVLLREAARRLRDGGRIVTVSTISARVGSRGIGLYSASKAAAEQLTAVAASELGERGITANVVSPGFTDTDLLRGSAGEEELPRLAAESPLGRLGEPADVAAVVAFLVSEDGRWVTGQNLRASGGA
jgi:3-oxoacyl-[acyl-carrier protein] reductase